MNQNDTLLNAVAQGNRVALEQLLQSHRTRLRQAIALRLPARIAARVDPSDIVQETFMEAARRIEQFLTGRRIAFYPWLRRLAIDQLARAQRHHMGTEQRTVDCEVMRASEISDQSWHQFGECLMVPRSGPLTGLIREETKQRVLTALATLATSDADVLTLRFLEGLTVAETAQVLDISESALKMRQLRALQRLQHTLGEEE